MLETIANIKNNKIKQQHGNVVDKEMVLKMKKFLSGLAKKRSLHSTEAIRVSLEDIHNIDTKGKWWLVGSSWKDNLVGTESKYASKEVADDLKKDASLQQSLMKLARKQGMNTDIRRSIFIVLMSSEVRLPHEQRYSSLTGFQCLSPGVSNRIALCH
jgi:nucleolar MIF4G domain-containing protein 1